MLKKLGQESCIKEIRSTIDVTNVKKLDEDTNNMLLNGWVTQGPVIVYVIKDKISGVHYVQQFTKIINE